jgi:mannose-6-phosphate isomerase-like protein (cupin superfamily)
MKQMTTTSTTAGLLGVLVLGGAVALFAQDAQGGRGGRGAGGGRGAAAGGGLVSMPVLQPEPKDNGVVFTADDLAKKYAEMEAATAGAWRIVDGGTRTVNIRIGTNDAPQVHPMTVEFWVIMKGTGTVTMGGKLVDGKIVGGTDTVIGPGSVVYVPATIPHGLTAAEPVTYVTTRYDIVPAAPAAAPAR